MTVIIEQPSPNWNERPIGCAVDTVVLHYTGMETGNAARARLCDSKAQVSAHYLVEEDGHIFRLVAEKNRAWHAGVSHWQGRENINDCSIGIEVVNPGHEFGYRAFPRDQITALLALLHGVKERHAIAASRFIGHSDIAPARKMDPGELFPWRELATHGFGIVAAITELQQPVIACIGNKNGAVKVLNQQLGKVGYDCGDSSYFGPDTKKALQAFQRHWRPDLISGIYDAGTERILAVIVQQMNR